MAPPASGAGLDAEDLPEIAAPADGRAGAKGNARAALLSARPPFRPEREEDDGPVGRRLEAVAACGAGRHAETLPRTGRGAKPHFSGAWNSPESWVHLSLTSNFPEIESAVSAVTSIVPVGSERLSDVPPATAILTLPVISACP